MLAIWPLVCLVLFMRMPPADALLWTVVGGFLILPSSTRFDLTGLPDLDKSSMIAIGAGLGTLLFAKRPRTIGSGWMFYGLGTAFIVSPFITAYFNSDPIIGNKLFFPGLTWYDGVSGAGLNLFALVVFWAGRRTLCGEVGHKRIVQVLSCAMLAYSIPILFEIRFSPQLHTWVYGFFPHEFAQQVRDGGYRAVVFLQHGLVVALILALGLVAACAQARLRTRYAGFSFQVWGIYLGGVMILQKSLGATVLAVVFSCAVLFLSTRRQLALGALVALVVVGYPLVRGAHLLPFEHIQSIANGFSSERGGSLNTRLVNEEELLLKANERPGFGWGGWGRNRYVNLETGRNQSITDGTWIIAMGTAGWFGYVALFGLLAMPIVRLWRLYGKGQPPGVYTGAVVLMLAVNLCDLLPNSSLTPITWLMAGALAGHTIDRRKAGTSATGGMLGEVGKPQLADQAGEVRA